MAGGREFDKYCLLKERMDYYLANIDPNSIEIVSGGAKGADSLGERYAKEKGYLLTIMSADWNMFGKSAGYIRNSDMTKYANACVAFWDGVSKGTNHMINLSKSEGSLLRVVKY